MKKQGEINSKFLEPKGFNDPNGYSMLYNRILSNIIPFTIKGTIWYQGESNVSNYNEYQTLFSAMIDDWRETWGYDFPFYYVQIAPFQLKALLEFEKHSERP